eukprot:6195039-Pleurochrysis_carterae.AAC.1
MRRSEHVSAATAQHGAAASARTRTAPRAAFGLRAAAFGFRAAALPLPTRRNLVDFTQGARARCEGEAWPDEASRHE